MLYAFDFSANEVCDSRSPAPSRGEYTVSPSRHRAPVKGSFTPGSSSTVQMRPSPSEYINAYAGESACYSSYSNKSADFRKERADSFARKEGARKAESTGNKSDRSDGICAAAQSKMPPMTELK